MAKHDAQDVVLSPEELRALEMRKAKAAGRLKKRLDPTGGITITSLMDAMTILLCFLLKSVGSEPISVTQSDDLMLPVSNTELTPEDTVPITLTGRAILVNKEHVVDVVDGQVDKSRKKGGETSLLISPLFDALQEETTHQKSIAKMAGAKFKGVATLIVHKDTPYRLLTEVMYTAGQAEFSNFKFAVIKKLDD